MIILLQREFGNKANKILKNKKLIEQAQKEGLDLGTKESDKLSSARFNNELENIDPLEYKKTCLDKISKSDKLDNNSKKVFKKDIVKYGDFYSDYSYPKTNHHNVTNGKLTESSPDYQIRHDETRLKNARQKASDAASSYQKKVKKEAYDRLSSTDKVKYHIGKARKKASEITRNLENGVYKERVKKAAPEIARSAKIIAESQVKDPLAYATLENIPGRINKLTGNRTKFGREDNELLDRLTKRVKRTTDIKPYNGLNSCYQNNHGRLGEIHTNSNNPAILAHEYGHALDQASNNGALHKISEGEKVGNFNQFLAKIEANASKNAMKVLEKEGATPKQMAKFRKDLLKTYGTYERGSKFEESVRNIVNGSNNREISKAFEEGRKGILTTGRHGAERVAGRNFLDKVTRNAKAKIIKKARNAKPGSILKKILK